MKMNIRDLGKVLAAIVAVAYGQTTFGQTTDDQVFTVTVPSLLSITAPANATIDTTTDQTDGNKVFTPGGPADHWAVTCNSSNGATVDLTALSPSSMDHHSATRNWIWPSDLVVRTGL